MKEREGERKIFEIRIKIKNEFVMNAISGQYREGILSRKCTCLSS